MSSTKDAVPPVFHYIHRFDTARNNGDANCLTYDATLAIVTIRKPCGHLLGRTQAQVIQCRPKGIVVHRKAILAHLDTGEAVALLPWGLSGYYFVNPSTGRKSKVTDSVAKHICEEALLFYKPLPAKPLSIRDLAFFIFDLFDRHDYATVIGAALIVTLVGLAPAWANKIAFQLVAPSGQFGLIGPVAALLLGATVCGLLTTICRNLVTASMTTKAEVVTEAAIFSRVLSLPATFFKRFSSGNLANRIGNVYSLVQKLVTAVFGSGLTSLFSLRSSTSCR